MDLHLTLSTYAIIVTSNVVGFNSVSDEVYSIQLLSEKVSQWLAACGFFHQWKLTAILYIHVYNWNIIESALNTHSPKVEVTLNNKQP